MDLDLAVGITGEARTDGSGSRDARRRATDFIRGPRPAERGDGRCPADRRIEAFLNAYFGGLTREAPLRLPAARALPRHGIARELSLPADGDTYGNEYVTSYRVRNG